MESVHIEWCNQEIEVKGKYYKPVPMDREYPGDPSEYEIDSIWLGGYNITEMLENDIDEIEDLCIKQIEE